MNYYKRHLGDYAKDTGHLSPLEHGVYTLLLDRYYSTERPIPASEATRVARARSEAEVEAANAVLNEFFKLVDGEWHHRYADRVIAAAQEKADASRENGRLGGRPASRKKPKGNPEETQQVSEQEPKKTLATSHKPLAISQEEKKPPDGGTADPKSLLWKTGVAVLQKADPKLRESSARAFLGQFAGGGKVEKLAEVIGYLSANPAVEPKAYIVAAMTRKSGSQQFAEETHA